ncbi:S-methyl-5-thioribose-1-phosphate isomerase [Deferrisoma camini]|uniref:S-methyl-5-thioribose-1-phosphate isomerase n=1 Tax=Deferrisoma camini TaxID=1035120 RepID=UPI00046D3D94|nr:S-methyl-5-thioribose-1-phosphate isomerase [Deferrisoma camini]
MSGFRAVEWTGEAVRLLDQRRLPTEETYHDYTDPEAVAVAIEQMVVRGAPAIGVTAAYGVALAARRWAGATAAEFRSAMESVFERFARTRPTAVNLFWALDRMRRAAQGAPDPARAAEALEVEARAIEAEDLEACRAMGRLGAELLTDPATVLTHCNAGALATAGYGTALGVIRAAAEAGKRVRVLADETRPFLQGARLTAWELRKDGIPVTLITDGMAGYRMKRGGVDAVVVGADRITRSGDVANKIGTYTLAVLAREHGVPFYVAAPLSTVDFELSSGDEIPIEERDPAEVTHCGGTRVAPEGVEVWNPAFDVTPARLVTAIVTERGVARPPYTESLDALRR